MPTRESGPESDEEAFSGLEKRREKRRRIDRNSAQTLTLGATTTRLPPDAYTVGWICAIATEYVAAIECLDEEHGRPQYLATQDNNDYTLGRVGSHNVVIAVLPYGEYGTASAASVATNMMHSFPNVRIRFLVGIAGGAPTGEHDVRLGDVVVSAPRDSESGVFQYDFGRTIQYQAFKHARFLNQPPTTLRTALNGIRAQYKRNGHQLEATIASILTKNPRLQREYQRPQPSTDRLFKAEITHGSSCSAATCADDVSNLVLRRERTEHEDNPAIHYGLIASANQLMRDALIRDKLAAEKNVLCFEMEAAGLMNHFACLVIRGICDYSDSHKNKEWQGYAAMAAAAYAKDLLGRIPPNKDEAETTIPTGDTQFLNDEQKQELLNSLRFDQIDARQMTIKTAHDKTCKWLLTAPQYVDWLEHSQLDEHHGFLWIKGKPGTGKSTLMKFALAHARKKIKDKIVLSFFFNARGANLEKSTIGMYRSLLLQLLERRPDLQGVFDSLGLVTWRSGPRQWSVESLKELFQQAVQGLEKSSLVCFIDALDECDENQIRDMVLFFEHIGELTTSANISFLVCFSSRHYPHITLEKGLSLVLEVQEGHSQDITSYLGGVLKIGHSKVAEQIRIDVQEKASGVFLWVVLVVEILNKEYDRGRVHALRTRLRDIPGDLHELFRDILTRDQQNRGELLLCIQWVLFARQPLRPEQLYFAILSGVEPEVLSQWDPDEITAPVTERYIIDSSKGLAEVSSSKSPTVQFIHESVSDFFLKENGLKEIWSDLGTNFQGKSHERLKQCCLNYMNIDIHTDLNISSSLPKASSLQAAELRHAADKAFPFLEYAVRNILYHANAAEGGGVEQTGILEIFPLADWVILDNLFERHEVRRHTQNASLLYIFAEHDMGNLIRSHPSKLSCFEVEDERYGAPIFAALATNSDEAVRALLNAQAEINPSTSPLHDLCEQYYQNGNRRPDFGRDFNFSRRRGVFSHLAEKGDEAMIVAFLLASDKGDLESRNNDERTPLSWAAEKGHEAVVKLLLETGRVEIEAKDNNGRTPLSWVAENGHEAVVKLLLDTGRANVEAKDDFGGTPLSWAARYGHEAVVKLLLETRRANVEAKDEAKDNSGCTPLFWAAQNGHEAAVKLLLDTGRTIVEANTFSQTPLSWAAQNGHEAVVKLLLDTGRANVEAKDDFGGTPLSWAARYGHEAVVKVLLIHLGVDPSTTGSADQTLLSWTLIHGLGPLFWASQNGYEAVVKLLLETGRANVEAKDNSGWTPLSWAVRNGHEAVVKLLLETGRANVEAKDNAGWTPLSWAAQYGHEAVIKLLLETGRANVEAKDNFGWTPLSWAAHYGHEAVVKMLQGKLSREDDQPGAVRSTSSPRSWSWCL
ncbi:Pfs, NB-ARC and Ankyrin domain protein, partial [Metarhizium majus ARSEF 297]